MPPVASKPASPFPAEEMVELLKQIEASVFNLVSTSKKRGAEVRQEVVVLLKKYMDLLTEARRECMFFRRELVMKSNLATEGVWAFSTENSSHPVPRSVCEGRPLIMIRQSNLTPPRLLSFPGYAV
ncbi:hypothetical protein Bbelb_156150 [Branchiostoma belcheri]|nr:hypothetical protein Bbelb_156150 [Branchiostoma belcheri]